MRDGRAGYRHWRDCASMAPMSSDHTGLQAILQSADAESATQQLAMELVAQPRGRRERLIRCLRALYRDGIVRSGQPADTARRLGVLLEIRLRAEVAHIEARGGGTVGTA
jgi:hypothetical protein